MAHDSGPPYCNMVTFLGDSGTTASNFGYSQVGRPPPLSLRVLAMHGCFECGSPGASVDGGRIQGIRSVSAMGKCECMKGRPWRERKILSEIFASQGDGLPTCGEIEPEKRTIEICWEQRPVDRERRLKEMYIAVLWERARQWAGCKSNVAHSTPFRLWVPEEPGLRYTAEPTDGPLCSARHCSRSGLKM
ncbi:hypothetical protein B0H14DRAFT_2591944 [Mycena olivaceomarginata]|nr:hypothetical protein B0H14DRAFT_2591944 [Mycena olivaceomarginata]